MQQALGPPDTDLLEGGREEEGGGASQQGLTSAGEGEHVNDPQKHGKKMFCEIDKEQLRVQEAYCLLVDSWRGGEHG